MAAPDYAARARALVGTQFRPQGRGPHGLDCLGLMIAVYNLPAAEIRRDYRLSGLYSDAIAAGAKAQFRRIPAARARAGDAMLFAIDGRQSHLAILSERGFIHAHAGIGRVVETPGAPEWPIVAAFRRRRNRAKG